MLEMPVDEVIDPHVHLFDLRGTPRPMQPLGRVFGWNEWLLRAAARRLMPTDAVDFFGQRTALLGDYLPEHLRADARTSRVGRYVHVQAGWADNQPLEPVGETTWLETFDDGPAAIVGHADLTLGHAVGSVLAAHVDASPSFRGIRHSLSWHPDPGVMDFAPDGAMMSTPEFRVGLRRLADDGLTFDAWCYGHQLHDLAALAGEAPEVDIVLCHVGTPVGYGGPFAGVGGSAQERARIGDEWRRGIDAVADRPNVWCKLSGMLMPVLGFGYEHAPASPSVAELAERLGPLVDHCIDAFGADRCMIASNFPVDQVSCDYETVTRAMLEITDRRGEDAQQAMFADVAARFYRLDA